jgi:hypothetical protein
LGQKGIRKMKLTEGAMKTVAFESFGQMCSGRIVTHHGDLAVVQSRNPFGGHNFVLVNTEEMAALRHGTRATLEAAEAWLPQKQFRRALRFALARGFRIDRSDVIPADRRMWHAPRLFVFQQPHWRARWMLANAHATVAFK